MSEISFQDVMSRLRGGDDRAAAEVFERFVHRLLGLARCKLNERLQAKVGAEDVLQSVYKSFFIRQRAGEFRARDWEELWALLAVITVRKCRKHIRAFRQVRRDANREVSIDAGNDDGTGWDLLSREPTPDEAAALTDTLEQVMHGLDEQGRAIVSLKLQGYTESEIGQEIGRTERTVRRILARVRQRLERIEADSPAA